MLILAWAWRSSGGYFRDGFALGSIRASAPYFTQTADVVENTHRYSPSPATGILRL